MANSDFLIYVMMMMIFLLIYYVQYGKSSSTGIFKCDENDCMYETYDKYKFIKHIKSHYKSPVNVNIYLNINDLKDGEILKNIDGLPQNKFSKSSELEGTIIKKISEPIDEKVNIKPESTDKKVNIECDINKKD